MFISFYFISFHPTIKCFSVHLKEFFENRGNLWLREIYVIDWNSVRAGAEDKQWITNKQKSKTENRKPREEKQALL